MVQRNTQVDSRSVALGFLFDSGSGTGRWLYLAIWWWFGWVQCSVVVGGRLKRSYMYPGHCGGSVVLDFFRILLFIFCQSFS